MRLIFTVDCIVYHYVFYVWHYKIVVRKRSSCFSLNSSGKYEVSANSYHENWEMREFNCLLLQNRAAGDINAENYSYSRGIN